MEVLDMLISTISMIFMKTKLANVSSRVKLAKNYPTIFGHNQQL